MLSVWSLPKISWNSTPAAFWCLRKSCTLVVPVVVAIFRPFNWLIDWMPELALTAMRISST